MEDEPGCRIRGTPDQPVVMRAGRGLDSRGRIRRDYLRHGQRVGRRHALAGRKLRGRGPVIAKKFHRLLAILSSDPSG